MTVKTSRHFDKQYSRLSRKVQQRFKQQLEIFVKNPGDPRLRSHALKGKYHTFRSIDVTGDVRALYVTKSESEVVFGFIGTHSQLY